MRRAWSRLWAMLRRAWDGGARDAELSEELRAFVEHDADSKSRSGMSPEEARRAALIELGGAEQVKEHVRESRAGARLESIFRDIRYAMRSLGRAPGFSLSVIGNLSLGLAAMIVAFAFINGMIGPSIIPGIQDQDRLAEIGILETNRFGTRDVPTALAEYPDVVRVLDEGMPSLEGLASFTESDVAVTLPEPRSLRAAFVSPSYFDVLGVRPEVGRTFAPEEGGVESPVAIISHALWTREFGGDPSVIGRPIQAGGRQTLEVIGVAPRGFAGTTGPGVDLWLPIAFVDRVAVDDPFGQSGTRLIRYVGRMRDGVGVDRVETELGVVARRLGVARPAGNPLSARLVASADDSVERVRVEVSGLSRRDIADIAIEAAVTLSVPFLVLALACVNAANLLLVRASSRSREVAVRLALGASRLRLVRQLIIESLVLAIGAALLALLLAWSGLQLVAAFLTVPMPVDGTVVAGALVTAFLTALGFGLVPALHATRRHPSAALGTAPAGSGGTRAEARGRRVLVAGQVALSLGLLAAAFQLTSGLESRAEPSGTEPERVLMASFDLAQLHYSSAESDAFYAALLDRASRLPGAEAAGLSSGDFATGWVYDPANLVRLDTGDGPLGPLGRPLGRNVSGSSAEGDFFKVLELDLIQGREFLAADRRDIPEVAIVTEHLASQIFDGAVLGQTLRVSPLASGAVEAEVRIVGIVESPLNRSIDNITGIMQPSPSGEVAAIFFPSPFPSPIQQGTARTLYVRSEGPAGPLAPAVRDLVAQIDPLVPILEMATLDQKIPDLTQIVRGLARAAAVLGIVAILLASIGLYGVTSYSVEMRTREIAVRMALGARADRVVAMVLRQALAVVMIGAVLGGLLAIAAGVVIQANLFGVPGVDVETLGGSAALLAAAMLTASLLPARRAARLDPNAVLRQE